MNSNYSNFMPNYYGGAYVPPFQTWQPQQNIYKPANTTPVMFPNQTPAQNLISPIQNVRYLTADQIKAYIVMPNMTELLIDKDNNLAHLKSADQTGQATTKIYRFQEVEENEQKKVETATNTLEDKLDNYVTKDMLSNLASANEIAQLKEQIEKLQKQIKLSALFTEGQSNV